MPIFEYKGLNKTGKNVKGVVDADNSRNAKLKLKRDGIYVVELKDKQKAKAKKKGKKSGNNKTVPTQDLAMMTRQLATLLKANIPLVDTLSAVSEQVENPILAEAVADMKNMVNEGTAFYKALQQYPKIFDRIYISMAEAGEMSGTLDVILLRLAEFKESQNELNSKVKSALMYPVLMFIVSGLLLAGIFIFIIPKMVTIFESSPELTLEWYTLAVIDISNFFINYWMYILIFMGLGYFLFRNWKATPNGEAKWDASVLKAPVVGRLVRTIAISRFGRTLATLLNGGVPMLQAMGIVRNVVNNHVLAVAIDNARDNISEGESITGPLKKSGQFPPLILHMINIGEKTGELENMLEQVADSYDFQVKNEIDGMTALLGPAMIVFMGLVIGVIVFAVMMPMFQLSNLGG